MQTAGIVEGDDAKRVFLYAVMQYRNVWRDDVAQIQAQALVEVFTGVDLPVNVTEQGATVASVLSDQHQRAHVGLLEGFLTQGRQDLLARSPSQPQH
ncbi:hypothetical protein D3C72_2126200 [compost metagenome]